MAYTAIDDSSAYFKVQLYTGDGGTTQAITFNDTDTNMQPDWVWIKMRSESQSHILVDSVRGANKYLGANHNNAEGTDINSVTVFGSDGFTVGNDDSVNKNTGTYVSWNWKETATAGFDIVSYTGNATGRTISHSLSAVPKWIIVKNRSSSENWIVYHVSVGNSKRVGLNQSNAESSTAQSWGGTTPTSSVITLGTSSGTNANGDDFIMYAFADVKGFSKFGKYSANNNADGPFVYLGFRPAWLMLKVIDGNTGGWDLYDNKRGAFNGQISMLQANANSAQATSDAVDFLSNGFKIRNTSGNQNGSGDTIIYMAFAESPFVNSNGVSTNAR